MPLEQRKEFANLMNLVNKKLVKEPVNVPFSAKEFKYKLGRIADEIYSRNNQNEITVMKRILRLAQQISERSEDELYSVQNIHSKAKKNKKVRNKKNLIKKRSDILKKIETKVIFT